MRTVLGCFAEREEAVFCRELFLFHFRRFGTSPSPHRHFTDQGASGRLLKLRNDLAHGSTLPDAESTASIRQHHPDLLTLLEKAAFLADLPLFSIESHTAEDQYTAQPLMDAEHRHTPPVSLTAVALPLHHVVVHNPATGAFLDLHPLLLYTECEEELAQWDEHQHRLLSTTVCRQRKLLFFNDLKAEDRIVLLDYWRGHHSRFKAPNLLPREFCERFPKPARPTQDANWFDAFIQEWTAHFVGREAELVALDRFMAGSPKRVLVVIAAPGMGKTTLLAKWANDHQAVRHFIREGDVLTFDTRRISS